MAARPACRTSVREPEEGELAAVTTAASSCAETLVPSGGVVLVVAGPPVEAVGGGVGVTWDGAGASGASFAGEELAGAEESGTILEGEEAGAFFFWGTGGTRGSARPVSLLPAPVLLAPVSSASGGEKKSSSARW